MMYSSTRGVSEHRSPAATPMSPVIGIGFLVVVGIVTFLFRSMHRELVMRRQWVIVCNTPGCSHLASVRITRESPLPHGTLLRWRDVCPCHVEWGQQNLELTEREDLASVVASR